MSYGYLSTGFVTKPLTAILQGIRERQWASPELGPNFDNDDLTPAGQLNGTFASEVAELWELGAEIVAGGDPEAAAGYALTVLASIAGAERRDPQATRVLLSFQLAAATTVPAGFLIAVDDRPDKVFELEADVTNPTGSTGYYTGYALCTEVGPITAAAGTVTEPVNTLSGLLSVTNLADAVPGWLADDDITLRQRRADQLALRGGSTIAAIRADLLDSENHPELEGIREALVQENTLDYVVGGLPPKSIHVIIDDGNTPTVSNNDIAQTIFESKAGGIATFGAQLAFATDENGTLQPIYFSRATPRDVWIALIVTVRSDFPADGADQIKAAIVASHRYTIGEDVIALQRRADALQVAGVEDVPTFTLGFSAVPVGTSNLAIAANERAALDTGRISVTAVPA
jgi:hypothetical protein